MKTTPFTEKHIALGAKMHEFAGYNMPIEYSGIIDEHLTVCNSVGVFDVSHMGEFWVKGPNALAFLQKVTSNNVAALTPGKIQYTCFPNEDGGIVDDLLVYHYEPEKYLLVVNAANMDKDWDWCVSHNTEGAELENSSDNIGQLAVQGPKAWHRDSCRAARRSLSAPDRTPRATTSPLRDPPHGSPWRDVRKPSSACSVFRVRRRYGRSPT